MGKQLSPLEKEFLIKRYLSNKERIKFSEFCIANNVSQTALKKWISIYSTQGIEGLSKGVQEAKLLPDGADETIENYKREIIKLRIENERLKKNYTVTRNQDGTTTYIRLKEKNIQ